MNNSLTLSVNQTQQSDLAKSSPYLNSEAFVELKDNDNFIKIQNGKYFIEWDCGADLSADTIESEWQVA